MAYLRQSIKGISWMGGLRFFTRGIAFIKIAIIARILSPAQYGLFGIATLVLAFLELFTETGINVFFIQGEGKLGEFVNTAWCVSIIRGFLVSALIVVTAPLIASFFNTPAVLSLLLLLSLVPLVRGFINPSIVRFQKELYFHKVFWLNSSLFLISSVVGVIIMVLYHSPAGLIIGMVVSAIVEVILSFVVVKPVPRLAFELPQARKIIKRGKWVTISGVFNYLFQQGDDIVVGKLLGEASLGLYQMAYKIATLPITEVADVVGRVTFPIYVRISGDTKRLKKAFLKTLAGVAILTIPFGVLILLFGQEIVLVVLGEKWASVVPVLKVLVIYGVMRSISGSSSALFLAVKKQEYVTAVTLVSILVLALSIIPLIYRYGIVGAGLATLVGATASVPVVLIYLLRVLRAKKS
jgi:O-antigen/teichoic acid export membrane protein